MVDNIHCMNDDDMKRLANLTLAPYIQLAVCLVDKPRKGLSNMFRHCLATMAILMDYGYIDPVLLKAAVIHDVIEDVPDFDQQRIIKLEDGKDVLSLVLEVSKQKGETKPQFLTRIRQTGTNKAKILKSADRISNLIDLSFANKISFIERYIKETETYILPITAEINPYMIIEIADLLKSRKAILELLKTAEKGEIK